jgi:hypothetical protein
MMVFAKARPHRKDNLSIVQEVDENMNSDTVPPVLSPSALKSPDQINSKEETAGEH